MIKQNINFKLATIQFFIMAAYASYFNFFILFLSDKGYSKLQCGMIQALIAVLTFLYQPILGYITDYYLSYKKIVILAMITLIGFAITIPNISDILLLMGIFIVLHTVTLRQVPLLIDGWTVAIKTKYPHINYEGTRGIGSLGAGIASIVMGTIISYLGYDKVFYLNAVLLCITFLVVMTLDDVEKFHKEEGDKSTFRQIIKQLICNEVYMTFMFSALFLNIGIKMINTFGPIMMQEVGGNSIYYGYTMFACGIVEALTFIVAGKLIKKVSLETIYIAAILSLGIGSFFIFVVHHFVFFIVGRIIMGMTYAIYTVMVVAYVNKVITPYLRATAMGVLMAGTGGIAQIFSSIGGGFILDKLGGNQVILIMSLLCFLTFILFIPNLIRSKTLSE